MDSLGALGPLTAAGAGDAATDSATMPDAASAFANALVGATPIAQPIAMIATPAATPDASDQPPVWFAQPDDAGGEPESVASISPSVSPASGTDRPDSATPASAAPVEAGAAADDARAATATESPTGEAQATAIVPGLVDRRPLYRAPDGGAGIVAAVTSDTPAAPAGDASPADDRRDGTAFAHAPSEAKPDQPITVPVLAAIETPASKAILVDRVDRRPLYRVPRDLAATVARVTPDTPSPTPMPPAAGDEARTVAPSAREALPLPPAATISATATPAKPLAPGPVDRRPLYRDARVGAAASVRAGTPDGPSASPVVARPAIAAPSSPAATTGASKTDGPSISPGRVDRRPLYHAPRDGVATGTSVLPEPPSSVVDPVSHIVPPVATGDADATPVALPPDRTVPEPPPAAPDRAAPSARSETSLAATAPRGATAQPAATPAPAMVRTDGFASAVAPQVPLLRSTGGDVAAVVASLPVTRDDAIERIAAGDAGDIRSPVAVPAPAPFAAAAIRRAADDEPSRADLPSAPAPVSVSATISTETDKAKPAGLSARRRLAPEAAIVAIVPPPVFPIAIIATGGRGVPDGAHGSAAVGLPPIVPASTPVAADGDAVRTRLQAPATGSQARVSVDPAREAAMASPVPVAAHTAAATPAELAPALSALIAVAQDRGAATASVAAPAPGPDDPSPTVAILAGRIAPAAQPIAASRDPAPPSVPAAPAIAAAVTPLREMPAPTASIAATAEPRPATRRSRTASRSDALRAGPPVPATAASTAQPEISSIPPTPQAAAVLAASGSDRQIAVARHAAWADGIARDIAVAGAGTGTARFTVAPATLGTVTVEISRSDGAADVRLVASSETARAALDDARPQLIAEAKAQGLHIRDTRIEIGAATPDGGGQDTHRRDAAQPVAVAVAVAPPADRPRVTNETETNSLTPGGYGGAAGGDAGRQAPQQHAQHPTPQTQTARPGTMSRPPEQAARTRVEDGRYA